MLVLKHEYINSIATTFKVNEEKKTVNQYVFIGN